MRPLAERFWSKVDRRSSDDCWLWIAKSQARGYGYFYRDGRHEYAHRTAYLLVCGPIPEGLDLDHLCRNTLCVNPAHLEAVPHRENIIRGVGPGSRAKDTHCKRGHEYTFENTWIETARGVRHCRACHAARERLRRSSKWEHGRQGVPALMDMALRGVQATLEEQPRRRRRRSQKTDARA